MLRGLLVRCARCGTRVPLGTWDSWARRWRTGRLCASCRARHQAEADTAARERTELVRAWLQGAPTYRPGRPAADRDRQNYPGSPGHHDPWVQELELEQAVDGLAKMTTQGRVYVPGDRAWPLHYPEPADLVHGWVTRRAGTQRQYRDALLLTWHNQRGSRTGPSRYTYYYDLGSVYLWADRIRVVWAPAGTHEAGYS